MHKQKVTKLGLRKLLIFQKWLKDGFYNNGIWIDHNGVWVLRTQRHIPSKINTTNIPTPPPPLSWWRWFYLVQFVTYWQNFLYLNTKHCTEGQEKKVVVMCPRSATKRAFSRLVLQWQQTNVQNSVLQMQSSCLGSLNLLLCSRFRCHRRCLRSLIGSLR